MPAEIGVPARRAAVAQGPTKGQLYAEAQKRSIEGRSSMTKQQLQNTLGH
ncbi:hypothetical protein [Streptomyces chartreusis]